MFVAGWRLDQIYHDEQLPVYRVVSDSVGFLPHSGVANLSCISNLWEDDNLTVHDKTVSFC